MTTNVPQTVFALFYAIMWGALANVVHRWRPYDTGHFFTDQSARNRFWLATLCNFLLPIMYFALILGCLLSSSHWDLKDWGIRSTIKVFLAALPSLGPFGFYRVWLALVQSNSNRYYPYGGDEACWDRLYPNLPRRDLDRNQARGNLVFAFIYLLAPLAIMSLGYVL